MIRDALLKISCTAPPGVIEIPTDGTLLAAGSGGNYVSTGIDYYPSPFPEGLPVGLNAGAAACKSIDLGSAMELAGTRPLRAVFRVTTAFTDPTATAANRTLARFCVFMASASDMLTGLTVLARSGGTGLYAESGFTAAALAKNFQCEVLVPRLDTLARLTLGATTPGKRYLGLGMELRIKTANFSAGAVEACLVLDSEEENFLRPRNYPTPSLFPSGS